LYYLAVQKNDKRLKHVYVKMVFLAVSLHVVRLKR